MAKIAFFTRFALVTNNGTAVASGQDFGVYQVTPYSRITGIASGVGSMSLRLRTGFTPTGPFVVSSTWVVNSGPNILDVPNYGSYITIDCTQATTTAPTPNFQLFGEPVR